MARIRSVYPGLFVDDAFMELSMAARVVLIGIWVQCDDHGIFEWRPKSLKAAILPGDDGIAMNDLLGELVDQKHIRAFEIDGKAYGAVRNFRKYQHPKKPTYYYPVRKASLTDLPTWVGPYIAYGSPSMGEHSPTNSPKEKEGDKEKEGEKDNSKTKIESLEGVATASQAPSPPAPDSRSKEVSQDLKGTKASAPKPGLKALGYPLPETWTPDDELCNDVKRDFGMSDDDIRHELIGFHARHAANGSFSANWRASFVSWCKNWKDNNDRRAPPRVEVNKPSALPRDPREWTPEQWEPHARFYARTGRWPSEAGPDPMSRACLCPREILAKHDVNETGERRIPPRKAAAS